MRGQARWRSGWSLFPVIFGLCACAARGDRPVRSPASPAVGGGLVAIVEWQFPAEALPPTDPLQRALPERDPTLRPAFAPNTSELSLTDGEALQARLQRHARQVAEAYASHPSAPAPLLLQVSAALPAALEASFNAGVRVVSFSMGSDTHLGWMDDFVSAHPQILFVVAAPHISGNSSSIALIGERPSVLAGDHGNVLLVGCLEPPDGPPASPDPARPLWEGDGPRGDSASPARVDNQPLGKAAPIVFIEGCAARSQRLGGPGSTSTAAPLLAAEILAALPADPTATVAPTVSAWLASRPTAWAVEEDGEVHAVPVLDIYR